ncbi:ABC transporter ATP-binding protein (plasmid) [Paroceanicella profunda]|uniref:ABC transporter ATP-binding protein n=1 Tax=Paroceanicella profunda TaxID=2579971 RepID=A0A5B8G4X4_9RHOB|nr:ABC transporter ATP-binding protein [Paroceanicella profunda]QDL94043.1 ABC transporter ATP-binding protein [Paroceanicella profunda]
MSDDTCLALERLTLAYGDTVAVDALDLTVKRGELIALLGPSGCGKTTTMRAIAGLLDPRSGTIRLEGADITRRPANKREIGLVFQSYALFPHLSVFENVAFGLRLRREPRAAVEAKVAEGLRTVGLDHLAARKPAELSGGQQQRVALARSLVMEPKLLLLDEPLSNLDARLRLEMRAELQRVQKASGITMIFVTHDQGEALALADRIVVMRGGAIEQLGTPEEIWNRPASGFVAEFVGFETVLGLRDGKLDTPAGLMPVSGAVPAGAAGLAWRPGAVTLGAGPFEGEVLGVSFAGETREYLLDSPLGRIKADAPAGLAMHGIGAKVAFDLPAARAAVLPRLG